MKTLASEGFAYLLKFIGFIFLGLMINIIFTAEVSRFISKPYF